MNPKHIFVVGAQRSGTTYLYHILNNHPDIEMNTPVVPEPKFFLTPGSENRKDEYEKKFFSNPAVRYWGDKSASYMEVPETAERISKCYPDAIILFSLRDPVDRAISHFRYSTDHNVETLPFEMVVDDPNLQFREFDRKISVSPFEYFERGKYINYMDPFAKHFPLEQLKILVFENFTSNEKAVKELYSYLGVDDNFVPSSLHETINFAHEQITQPTPEVLSKIAAQFEKSNALLQEKYGVNISKWNRVLA